MKRSASPPATLRTPKPTSPTSKRVITGANTPAGASRKPSSTSATPLNSTPTTPWLLLRDILEVQDRLTRQLLNALKLKLTGDEEKRVTARYTENAEAYQSYLEARYHWSKYTRRGIEKAIVHFRHAIELDPNYALAYAGIIDCYLRLATNYLPPEETRRPRDVASIIVTALSCDLSQDAENSDTSADLTNENVTFRFEWDWKAA